QQGERSLGRPLQAMVVSRRQCHRLLRPVIGRARKGLEPTETKMAADGPRHRLLRDLRLGADRTPGAVRAARPAWRRAAPVRLRGMLKTLGLRGRDVGLTVYGPPGLVDLFGALRRIFGKLPYALDLVEVRPGDALRRHGYSLVAFPVAHGVSAVGYALVEEPRP